MSSCTLAPQRCSTRHRHSTSLRSVDRSRPLEERLVAAVTRDAAARRAAHRHDGRAALLGVHPARSLPTGPTHLGPGDRRGARRPHRGRRSHPCGCRPRTSSTSWPTSPCRASTRCSRRALSRRTTSSPSSSTAPGGPADALPPHPHLPHAVCRPAHRPPGPPARGDARLAVPAQPQRADHRRGRGRGRHGVHPPGRRRHARRVPRAGGGDHRRHADRRTDLGIPRARRAVLGLPPSGPVLRPGAVPVRCPDARSAGAPTT